MRKILTLLSAAAFVVAPASADENLRKCLAERVLLSNAKIYDMLLGDELGFDIRNDLAWPISGIRFRYSVNSGGGAWEAALEAEEAIEIIEGVQTGQSVSVSLPVEGIPKDFPQPFLVEVILLDVADSQKRQVINDVQMPNWEKASSPEICR